MTQTPSALTLDVTLGKAMFSATGGSEHVLQAFSEFQALVLQPTGFDTANDESADATEGDQQVAPSSPPSPSESQEEERIPLPVFLASKALKGNNMVALGIAVWAKRYEGIDAVDAETARGYWRTSGMKMPGNISRDLSTAATAGWLEKRGRSFFITSFGERFYDGLGPKEK